MKWFSFQKFILILLISSNFVTGQLSQPEETLGVNVGDTFNYVISRKSGIDGPVYTDGYKDLNLEDGDTFNVTVLDVIPSIGNTIDLELWNHETNVTYENTLGFFDFIWYVDWEYTVSFLENFNLDYYIDGETIHFTFFIEIGDGEATYFEYAYILETGVLFHKFEYTAPVSDFGSPSKVLQIDLGSTPLPRPNIGNIGFEVGDFYIYEMIQIQGFEVQSVFQGNNGTFNVNTGDQFIVTPLSSEPNTVHSVPISFQSKENGIVYNNKLDFHNSVNNPSFFVYTDWEYIETIVKISASNTNDETKFEYSTTSAKFIYKESFVSADSYYKLELHYDLDNGVLLYESLVLENFMNVSFGIIEFQLSNPDDINQDKFSIDLDFNYNYKLIKYESTDYKPYFSSNSGNLWLFSGDTFSISPISSPNNDELNVYVEADGDQIQLINRLDVLGSYFIYTDWGYWNALISTLNEYSPPESSYQLITANSEVQFTRILETPNLRLVETMIYEETTGVLSYYTFEISGTDRTGARIFTSIELELESIELQTISHGPEEKSNGDDGLIILLPFILLSGLIIILIIQQKRSK